MNIRERIVWGMESTLKRVYKGKVKYVVDSTGANRHLGRIYARLLRLVQTPEMNTITVNDVDLSFENQGIVGAYAGEYPVIQDVLNEIQQEDVFWDIGAAFGLYSCSVATSENVESVIAVEPTKRADTLKTNLSLNGFSANVIQKAISDSPGCATISEKLQLGKGDGVAVDVVTGDQLVQEGYPVPSIMKIDVEGAEYNVLNGMGKILSDSDLRVVYCEIHRNFLPDFGASPEMVEDVFESHGFDLEIIEDNGSGYNLKATR
ncbi:FkbM family methyltransferase [Haloferax sp. DFSO52]|uniref:FkbM family methyltransferase n=1 Tax=Haloferax sp. DFSO52 TaxID=3388505 RepID=UPI003A8A03EF